MLTLLSLLILILILIGADLSIYFKARIHSHQDAAHTPVSDFGLILGTAKYIGNSNALNRYYQYRIDAAIELWRAGKVKQFIVSGSGIDNTPSETACMQADLIAASIPADKIWQDPAGLRTLDSIIRYRQSFPEQSVCIISQPFHNQRALIQAQAYRLNACAYDAQVVDVCIGWKVHARERAARLRLWYDLISRRLPQYSVSEVPIQQYQ